MSVGRAGGAALAAHLAPSLLSVGPVRRRVAPELAGQGPTDHVALTYDDGPDRRSTPAFLDLLARHDRRATFFLLGEHVADHRGLVAEMVAAGHELGVHGWDHRCGAWRVPGSLADGVRRTRDLLEDVAGSPVRWYRPPYGVLTAESLLAGHRADLRTVLWTTWGRDWTATATPRRIASSVRRRLGPGGTVLLHDTDRTSAPGSWERTLVASEVLLAEWAGRPVGPLADHGLRPLPPSLLRRAAADGLRRR